MKSSNLLVLLLITSSGFIAVHAKKFAVLVATTKSWLYYGHQSTVLHAYHTLIANGFPKSDIITMLYDDIAHNPKNPDPGVIRNHPQGINVNENVRKDYTRQKVNADNFIAVLKGNSSVAQGPVIHSSSKDSLFIYIVGLGSLQYLTFPTGPGITARNFVNILESLTNEGKFKKIFLMIETSFGASLFDGLLSTNNSKNNIKAAKNTSYVFVSTATYHYEHPYAVFCVAEKRTCHGSLYGIAWTRYSDRLRQLKSGDKKTLFDQFTHVRTNVPYTHVSIYGDASLGSTKLEEFLGYKHEEKQTNKNMLGLASFKKINSMPTNHFFGIQSHENMKYIEGRNVIKATMKNIFERLNKYGYKNVNYENSKKINGPLSERSSKIYEQAIHEFHERCININENPFALQEISKIAHLCEKEVHLSDQIKAMVETCTAQHRHLFNVH